MKIINKKNINSNLIIKFLNNNKVKNKNIQKTFKNVGFKGEKGDMAIFGNTLYVGIKNIDSKVEWRELGFNIVNKIKNLVKTIYIEVPKNSLEFIEGLYLGSYQFLKYKSIKNKNKLKTIYLSSKNNKLNKIIKYAKIKIKSQFLTRDWVNTSPEDAYSETILNAVLNEFKNNRNIKIKIYREKSLKKLKMNGHLAVNRASRHEALTIKIEYFPNKIDKNIKPIILIGKGLTFDSGGLSLKPAKSMVDMKCDKAGAMTVLGIIKGISEMKINKKVIAYLGIAENMIDGNSYKPDDIITMMNGKTVHIKNTDAEGRLVIFDNLCLAEKENKKIDKIFTFATLTGSAVVQFGEEACGLVGFNDKLKKEIIKSGKNEDEIFMNAEFHKYMLNGVNDSLADLSNTGTPHMGCQKAGLFLTNALSKKNKNKYLHLDIAGPAFASKTFGTNVSGGTGFAVRTFIEYLKNE